MRVIRNEQNFWVLKSDLRRKITKNKGRTSNNSSKFLEYNLKERVFDISQWWY